MPLLDSPKDTSPNSPNLLLQLLISSTLLCFLLYLQEQYIRVWLIDYDRYYFPTESLLSTFSIFLIVILSAILFVQRINNKSALSFNLKIIYTSLMIFLGELFYQLLLIQVFHYKHLISYHDRFLSSVLNLLYSSFGIALLGGTAAFVWLKIRSQN